MLECKSLIVDIVDVVKKLTIVQYKHMQKHITKFLILTIILTAALSVNYLFAAWVGPTQAPPGGNTSTPIHVGSTDQVKDGGLSVNALSVFGSEYVQGTIQIGNNSVSPQDGTIRWTGTDFEGYMGGSWVSFTGAALSITCTDFTYSGWGACLSNNTKTRSVTSSSPENCTGGNPVITQSCTYNRCYPNYSINFGGASICLANGAQASATKSFSVKGLGCSGRGCSGSFSVTGSARVIGGSVQTRSQQSYMGMDSGWVGGSSASTPASSATANQNGVTICATAGFSQYGCSSGSWR